MKPVAEALLHDWPLEDLRASCRSIEPALTIEVWPEIDSTNSELMRRARAGQAAPTLLVAERQTLGRGRSGRVWHADPKRSLTFSLGLVPPLPPEPRAWSGLSLAVGVAVAGALHPEVGLKWPNDLWWRDHKLGGILIETTQVGSQRYAVVGIGLNLRMPLQDAIDPPGVGIDALLPGLDAPGLLLRVAPAVLASLQRFGREGLGAFLDDWRARDVLAGRAVRLSDGRVGKAIGIDANGALQIEHAGGIERIESASLSVRPLDMASPLGLWP
jgi:BirA family biotin operon repressor/biotin-[acetyl-CoA-carboxylase] ligase